MPLIDDVAWAGIKRGGRRKHCLSPVFLSEMTLILLIVCVRARACAMYVTLCVSLKLLRG